ncbi:uncharacterized protein PgNI_01266, partial [Pyricularia grisea]|uniref:Uncharacterized protein n=1 Tax=Pyricularia grisea TaxID=148305 RepID=A0A6P8BLW2_PYRGI
RVRPVRLNECCNRPESEEPLGTVMGLFGVGIHRHGGDPML